jgi:hypothetical protein
MAGLCAFMLSAEKHVTASLLAAPTLSKIGLDAFLG